MEHLAAGEPDVSLWNRWRARSGRVFNRWPEKWRKMNAHVAFSPNLIMHKNRIVWECSDHIMSSTEKRFQRYLQKRRACLGARVRLLAARGVKSAGWAFGPRVKAPARSRAAGGWRELSDLLSDAKNKTISSLIFTLCVTHLTHTLSPPDGLHESEVFLCVVCNQRGAR